MRKFFSRALTHTCCLFTVLTLAFSLFGYLLSSAKQPAMTTGMLISLFFFSLLMGFSSALLRNKKLPAAVRYGIHGFAAVGGFLLIYLTVLGRGASPSSRLVCVILSLVVYLLVMLCRAGILSAIQKKKESTEK